ncbi:MAG: hypothetical protein IH616_16690 [Gemmatimonadales bacterium]|jgi:hypothetical protein|nr:hypothetical protein [Gemmatimonadales bacterium]
MSASHRTTIVPGHRAEVGASTLETAFADVRRLLRRAGTAIGRMADRLAERARALTPRQIFAAALVTLILLYLFVLVVEPTGAGRGGR